MNTALRIILILLLLTGCSAPPSVAWVDGPPVDEAEVLDHLARAQRSYEAKLGPLPRPVAVLVLWPYWKLPTNGRHGGWATWSPSWNGVVVHVAYRNRDYKRIYVHELHHVRIGDPQHLDPSWRDYE